MCELIPSMRRRYARRLGFDPNTADPAEKAAMMAAYIAERYGTAEQMWRQWQTHGWYAAAPPCQPSDPGRR